MQQTQPAKPVTLNRAKQVGECISVDFSYLSLRPPEANDETLHKLLLAHIVDEASRFHVCVILKEGNFRSDKAIGNVNSKEFINFIQQNWIRFFQSPKRMHVDAENLFNSEEILNYMTRHDIAVRQCAGEAHWQNGLVERHIKTITNTIQKLYLDAPSNSCTLQEIVDAAT